MRRQQTIGFVFEEAAGREIFIWFVLCIYDFIGNEYWSISSEDNGRRSAVNSKPQAYFSLALVTYTHTLTHMRENLTHLCLHSCAMYLRIGLDLDAHSHLYSNKSIMDRQRVLNNLNGA